MRRDRRCSHLASAQAKRARSTGRQGGQIDGNVSYDSGRDGTTVFRLGAPLSGSSENEMPPTNDEIRRSLERDLSHVRDKLRTIKEK
ncbi:MAG: hypothetical protein QNJ14_04220 [Woeseiaceae bacterium]|nr:hypothetical protein [Woeseiaceae bacterium]